jgi:hypothetical protein
MAGATALAGGDFCGACAGTGCENRVPHLLHDMAPGCRAALHLEHTTLIAIVTTPL